MGYGVSYLAVRGKSRAAVLEELGLLGSGEYEELPEAPNVAADLPNGWLLVFANRDGFIPDHGRLARLSRGAEVITCGAEEHVMFSYAEGWKDGLRRWSIAHEAERGIDHLDFEGELPPCFASIRDRLTGTQGDGTEVDYIFDIPIDVVETLTGFRYDKDIEGTSERPFERLTRPKKWWQFWK